MPGVLSQSMTLTRENQQFTGNIQFIQCAIEQIVLKYGYANVIRSSHHMSGSSYFIDLINCRLAAITVRYFPCVTTQKIDIVESGIVVAPVSDVLHRSCASDGRLESSSLRDQPVGHVAAIAVAAYSQAIRIGDAIL